MIRVQHVLCQYGGCPIAGVQQVDTLEICIIDPVSTSLLSEVACEPADFSIIACFTTVSRGTTDCSRQSAKGASLR